MRSSTAMTFVLALMILLFSWQSQATEVLEIEGRRFEFSEEMPAQLRETLISDLKTIAGIRGAESTPLH